MNNECAEKAYQFQPVKVWPEQRLATSSVLNPTGQSGNGLSEAGRREVSGCNESECIEPRNNQRVGGRSSSFGNRQYSHNR
jgi:hypothetical protein